MTMLTLHVYPSRFSFCLKMFGFYNVYDAVCFLY